MFYKTITLQFFKVLDKINKGSIRIVTPDQKIYEFSGPQDGPHIELKLYDWRTIPLFIIKADIGLAESYRDGWWDTDSLETLLRFGLENSHALQPFLNGRTLTHFVSRFMYFLARNTLRGSKKNIHAHYDLGNDFYGLWLDPTMSYSSALDVRPEDPLSTAQLRKYDRILDCLESDTGSILEVGCGWGGFAERAAQKTKAEIKGITISEEQFSFAQNRLGSSANIALEDYRNQQGTYDRIVSIEMFEAVGEAFWPVYFQKLKSLLSVKGKAVIQTITVEDDCFDLYRRSGDMIRTFIFPGGMLPSVTRFNQEAQKAGLSVSQPYQFGQDYARTSQIWLQNFDHNLAAVRSLGFDEKFIRIWRFYLASCIALFQFGRTNVMQVELAHA